MHRSQAGLPERVHEKGPRRVLHEAVRQSAGDVPARFIEGPDERGAQGRFAADDDRDPEGSDRAGGRGGDEAEAGARDAGPRDPEHPERPGDAPGVERHEHGPESRGGAPEEPHGHGEDPEAHQRGHRADPLTGARSEAFRMIYFQKSFYLHITQKFLL